MDRGHAQQHRHLVAVLVAQAPFGHVAPPAVKRRGQHREIGLERYLQLAGEQQRPALQRLRAEQRSGQRMADQRLFAVAEQALGGRVDAGDDAVRSGHQYRAGGTVEDGLLQRRLLGVAVRQQMLFEQADHLASEALQGLALLSAEPPRLAVDHAQGAEVVAIRRGQRRAGIEADMRIAEHQRVVAKTRVLQRIRYLEDLVAGDGVGAEGDLPRGLADVEADPALEPLTAVVDQRDQRDGRVAHLRGKRGEVIEGAVLGGVEDFVAQQRCQA